MAEVHLLTRCAERRDSEEHECHTEEEVADITVALAVDEQQGDEERGEHEVRHVEREAKRHNPRRERSADIGTHNNRDGLSKG